MNVLCALVAAVLLAWLFFILPVRPAVTVNPHAATQYWDAATTSRTL